MITLVMLLKRKPGMTKEAFREHYERSHVAIAKKYTGHLFLDYRRNYVMTGAGFEASELLGVMDKETPYDVITVVTLKDQAALDELNRISALPEVKAAFMDDEELFIDRPKQFYYICDEVKTAWAGAEING